MHQIKGSLRIRSQQSWDKLLLMGCCNIVDKRQERDWKDTKGYKRLCLVCLVENDSLKLGLEPLDCVLLGDHVLDSDLRSAASATSHTISGPL